MNKLITPHFSLADWYFTPGVGWMTDNTQYVSPPTAVTIYQASTTQRRRIYLGDTLGLCIPEGRLATYHRYFSNSYKTMVLTWRCQSYTDIEMSDNSYYCRLFGDTYRIAKKVAGTETVFVLGDLPYARQIQTWERFRISWWLALNEEFSTVLRMLLEQEHDGEWVELPLATDTTPSWSESETNRVGIHIASRGFPGSQTHLDDTEVWRKT